MTLKAGGVLYTRTRYSCTLVAANPGPDPDGLKGASVCSLLIRRVLNNTQLLQATSQKNVLTVERES